MKFCRALLVTLSTAASCFGAMVVDVQADITNLTNNVTAFNTSLAGLDPNNLLLTGLDALFAGGGVIQALNESITDAQALNHPVKNPDKLIASFSTLSTVFPVALDAIASAKPQFAAIPTAGPVAVGAVGGIAVSLQGLFQLFATGVVASLPVGQQSSLDDVLTSINASFSSLIETYAVDICANRTS